MVVPFDAGTLRNPQHEFQGPVVHRLQIPRKHRGSHKVPLVQGAEEAEEDEFIRLSVLVSVERTYKKWILYL